PQVIANGLESRLIDVLGHHLRDGLLIRGPGSETRFPLPEGAIAIGDREQADMRHVVEHRDRRIEQAIAEGLFEIGQREQLLAQVRTVLYLEAPDAGDPGET